MCSSASSEKEVKVLVARGSVRRSKYERRALKSRSRKVDGNTIVTTLLPSLIGVTVAVLALMAKLGFRGRATVAGIDLGTTNSVICVQAPSSGVGVIECIPDPKTGSAIVPSVVSMPGYIVGDEAKARIDTHPHSTIYHAKRIIGRVFSDKAVKELQHEVEFDVIERDVMPVFHVLDEYMSPAEVGSYVLKYLLKITSAHLGHSSVTSAVITIPAEFSPEQRIATIEAYKLAGIQVLRVLEEPTAAALAYGLDKKVGVEHVLVYDFGGGTLDVSILRMGQDGYIDVMGSAGDSQLGGADFDDSLVKFIDEKNITQRFHDILLQLQTNEEELISKCNIQTSLCALSSLHTIAERIKILLSSTLTEVTTEFCLTFTELPALTLTLTDICPYLTQSYNITITRQQFHHAVQHLYPRSVLPIRQVLHDLDLKPEDIDEVVMVGGTTRMLHIRELVKQELHVHNLNVDIDPDITVAYGAASVID